MRADLWLLRRREGAEAVPIIGGLLSSLGEGAAAGGAAAGGGTAGTAAAAGEGLMGLGSGLTMSGAPVFGSSMATPFSFSGAPITSGAAEAAGAPAATATPSMIPTSGKGGPSGGGVGDFMKGLGGGSAGSAATQLMKMAQTNQARPVSPPGLATRAGAATQPSIQQFLQMLGRRQPATLRMGM